MEQTKLAIPAKFVCERVCLSWREVLFGLENELLDPGAAVDVAAIRVAVIERPSSVLLELAAVERNDSINALVKSLAATESEQAEPEIREKWLYLVLAWIFDHRDRYADPLGVVEGVYADFNYPKQISGLIRYMPLDEPDLGSRELNEQRLHERWKTYLDRTACRYLPDEKGRS